MRVDLNSLISGAVVCGDRGLGVLGSTILADTATGDYGAGYLYNDVDTGDEAKEFRGLIVTPPAAGTFFAYEDGSFSLVAPDGAYTFVYRLYVDGVDLGTATASVTIGATATASLAITTDSSVFAGAATVSPVAALSISLDEVVFSGAASVGAGAALSITTDESTFSGSASVSPLASLAVITDSATFAGTASTIVGASLAITTDSAVFSGSAQVSPVALMAAYFDSAVFAGAAAGFALPNVPSGRVSFTPNTSQTTFVNDSRQFTFSPSTSTFTFGAIQ